MRYYIIPLDKLREGAFHLACTYVNCQNTPLRCSLCVVCKADPEVEHLAEQAFQRWQHESDTV